MKFGSAFSDTVIAEKKSSMRFGGVGKAWWLGAGRALLFATILCVVFFILVFRLFSLTLISGHTYRVLADDNRTKELVAPAPRGLLLDRTGKPIVENILEYRLLTPCSDNAKKLCSQIISQEAGDQMKKTGMPAGAFLEAVFKRNYLFPQSLAFVTGYTGELTAQELTDDFYTVRNYKAGNKVGRTGAEAIFEDRLRGKDGKELVEVDATGKTARVLGSDPAIPGENITLSVDSNLSEVVKNAFPEGKKGAVVVSNPTTGEIFALYSSPSFSLNDFTSISADELTKIMNDPDQPMFDRAIGGVYPPGSTFKIVTALAALEENAITKDTKYDDEGVIKLGQFTFPNWYFLQYGKVEGLLNVVTALKRSNDIFFYKAGEAVGITKLANWAHTVGIGKPLGIELPGEAAGLMPDPVWKNLNFVSPEDRQARNNLWFTGDTYHVSIGQGYLLTTPLQVNTWTNVIANGGKLCRPTIIKTQGSMTRTQQCKDLGIQKETIDTITEGMKEACTTGGTGWPFFDFHVPVACKTGTAEFGDTQTHPHAWFTAFAPVSQSDFGNQHIKPDQNDTISGEPEISVTVLVEGAGEGSDIAGPVAKKILEAWFSR